MTTRTRLMRAGLNTGCLLMPAIQTIMQGSRCMRHWQTAVRDGCQRRNLQILRRISCLTRKLGLSMRSRCHRLSHRNPVKLLPSMLGWTRAVGKTLATVILMPRMMRRLSKPYPHTGKTARVPRRLCVRTTVGSDIW